MPRLCIYIASSDEWEVRDLCGHCYWNEVERLDEAGEEVDEDVEHPPYDNVEYNCEICDVRLFSADD